MADLQPLLTWQKSILYFELQSSEQNFSSVPLYFAVTNVLEMHMQ